VWQDFQEAFYILFGPYLAGLLLPVFIAAGLLLAMLMSVAKFWRPIEKVEVTWSREDGQQS
jgi:hypothetical protein